MASESDIRKMLVDALRPSIQEAVRQELAALNQMKAEFANSSAAIRREIDELRATISEEIAHRTGLVLNDLQRHVDQEIGAKLGGVRSQFVMSTAELHALRDDVTQKLARLAQDVNALDRRLRSAGAALTEESSPQPASAEARTLEAGTSDAALGGPFSLPER
jgi:chromosome segregation ATPase